MVSTSEASSKPALEDVCLERFLRFLAVEKNYSPHTLAAYQRDISFVSSIYGQPTDWPALLEADIRACVAKQHRQGKSANSIKRFLSSVRQFYAFLIRQRIVKDNPVAGISAPKGERKLPKTLDADQMVQWLESLPCEKPIELRDKAILECFYSSGLRLSELAGLKIYDLDLKEGFVRVLGKGRKEREVPLGAKAASALAAWLKTRVQWLAPDEDVAEVFITKRSKAMHVRTIEQRVEVLAKRAGVDQHVHPHMLRHAFASHMLQSSQDLRAVQELLGHADISATQVYTHLDFQHLANVYDQAHPRAQKKRAKPVESND